MLWKQYIYFEHKNWEYKINHVKQRETMTSSLTGEWYDIPDIHVYTYV